MRTHLDLFSGIGGFALAASWAGYETVMFCEIEPFACQVLTKNFPGVPIHDDVRTLRGQDVRQRIADTQSVLRHDGRTAPNPEIVQRSAIERVQRDGDSDELGATGSVVDLLTGGFPCQPFSVAGKQRGADDDRHLWPEMVRVIDEVRPRWVLGENVNGFIPMALDDCLADLESLGYEAWAVVVPACAVGAWHRRDRVWIVAHSERLRQPQSQGRIDEQWRRIVDGGETTDADSDESGRRAGKRFIYAGQSDATGCNQDAADATRQQSHRAGRTRDGWTESSDSDWWESESRLRGVPDGLSTGVAGRAAKLKALGNAIVPQVAYEIIRLMDCEVAS